MIFIVMVMSLIQGFECHGGTVAFVAAGIYLFVILCISIGFFIFGKTGEERRREERAGRGEY